MSVPILQESFMKYNAHVTLMIVFESYTPKHHICFHLVANIGYHGNPNMYSNWIDETLNRTLKACCRNVSQQAFEGSLLLRVRDTLRPSMAVKRSRK